MRIALLALVIACGGPSESAHPVKCDDACSGANVIDAGVVFPLADGGSERPDDIYFQCETASGCRPNVKFRAPYSDRECAIIRREAAVWLARCPP